MKMITTILWTALTCTTLACATTQPTQSSESAAPTCGETAAEPDFRVLEWDAVAAAMADGALLVDARGAASFERGHIQDAVHGPSRDQEALGAVLPADKSRLLIFYCGGPACSASTRAARFAHTQGYTAIAEYKGGYPDWKERQSDAAPAN